MKTLFALTIGFLGGALLAASSIAGPEKLQPKEMAPAPAMEQPCNWTGLYIGSHFGYGGGDLTWSDTDTAQEDNTPEPNVPLVDHNQHGFFAGGQLGYNYQIGSWFVLGAEGTFSFSDVRGHTIADILDEPNVFDTHNDWTGTLAGRAGVAFHQFLFYAKGGVAFAHQKYSWLHGDTSSGTVDAFHTDETRIGPMVGVGVEYAINCNWSAKIEYNHLFLGADDISGTRIDDGQPEPESFQVDFDQDSVQVGLNYKFWRLGAHDSPGLTMGGVDRLDAKSMAPAPAIEQPCSWTGFYIGIHGGYAEGDLDWVDADTGQSTAPEDLGGERLVEHTQKGGYAGGQLGYNYQWHWLVVGAEGEFSYADVKAHTEFNLAEGANLYDTRNDWTGTIGLRAGVTFCHFLFYAKGAAAFVHQKYSWIAVDPEDQELQPFSADEWRAAPLVGGGVEYAINCHWSAKVEYRHLFLGTDDITGTRIDGGVPEQETYQVKLDQNAVEVGLNYKF